MFSARTTCPECESPTAVDLADLLHSPYVDFFRCRACRFWWMLPKGKDGPATRVIFDEPDWAENEVRRAESSSARGHSAARL